MTPLELAISRALIHFVWQGSIVWLVLSMILRGLRKKSTGTRYAASCTALAILAVMPVITAWALYSSANGSIPEVIQGTASAIDMKIPADPAQFLWLTRLQTWAIPAWSIGVVAFSIRLVLGCRYAYRLRRRAMPAGECIVAAVERLRRLMGVDRRIRILLSAMSDSPSVVGWLRPVILLPAATLTGLTSLQLEAILAHEIGHIKRYDYVVNIVQMVLETLLFYHPAVWWTSKMI